MPKKSFPIIFVVLFIFLIPFTAQSEGIPLQKDMLLDSPILAPEDLPEEITFALFDSKTAIEPLAFQTFTRGQYAVDFEFSKSDGITSGNVARVSADFTNILNLKDSEGESIQPKEIWAALEVGDAEVGERNKLSDETLVQLLLASDASIATYLTLVYQGDDDPITTIYKNLPIFSLVGDGSKSSLNNYFSAVAAGISEDKIIGAMDAAAGSNGQIQYSNSGVQAGASQFYYDDVRNRVGIGTTSPNMKLEIVADNDLFALIRSNNGDGSAVIDVKKTRGTVAVPTAVVAGDLAGMFNFRIHDGIDTDSVIANVKAVVETIGGVKNASGSLIFGTTESSNRATERMRINSNGNVGIGTTNPGAYKLAVVGSIRAQEIVVDTGWADFVFEDSYELPPLNEVEQYISQNKHLPGIPTAAQVEGKGVSVGNITSKLLQKIEELTLYVINLKKENETIKTQLAVIHEQLRK